VDGFALTRLHDASRIRLLCRAHNQRAAEEIDAAGATWGFADSKEVALGMVLMATVSGRVPAGGSEPSRQSCVERAAQQAAILGEGSDARRRGRARAP
jgi:hypothetical protein